MRLQLSIRCTLTNLTDLTVPSDFLFHFKVKCTSCNEIHSSEVTLSPTDNNEISGSRGSANFVWKCGFCKRESVGSLEPKSLGKYMADDAGNWKSLAVFECRGLEFVEFVPTVRSRRSEGLGRRVFLANRFILYFIQSGFTAKSTESKTVFDDVDLSDPESGYSDYDEAGKCEVAVMDFESKFDRAK